jgi:hypothetical protein
MSSALLYAAIPPETPSKTCLFTKEYINIFLKFLI